MRGAWKWLCSVEWHALLCHVIGHARGVELRLEPGRYQCPRCYHRFGFVTGHSQ